MLTTLLDGLLLLGRATLHTVWLPVLAWTGLALPIWWGVERAGSLHPLVTYRVHQTLLGSLPLGLLAAAIGGSWTGAPGPLLELPTLTVGKSSLSAEALGSGSSGSSAVPWHWVQGVGLISAAAVLSAVGALGRLALDALAALRVRTAARRLDPSVRKRVRRLLHATGLRRSVYVCTHTNTVVPATIAGRRPAVLLPTSLLQSPEPLRMALAHERVHLRRYDDLAHLLERLVVAVFTIHPFVHRLFADIRRTREQACDAAVLSDTTVSPAAYAHLLSTFATGSASPTGALSLSESSSLLSRLRAMQSVPSPTSASPSVLTAAVLTVGLGVLLGMAACTDSLTGPSSAPAPDETAASPSSTDTLSYTVVDTPPSLNGGMAALQDEITYPEMAREAGIEGRVVVQFVVDTDGTVQAPTVTRGAHKGLNKEALRAIRALQFEPGRQDGTPVRVQMSLPVTFQLPDSETTESGAGIAPDASSETDSQIEDRVQNAFRSVESPDRLRKAGVAGRVVVTFAIGSSGQIQNPRVVKSAHEALNAAALEPVRDMTFDAMGQSAEVPPSNYIPPLGGGRGKHTI